MAVMELSSLSFYFIFLKKSFTKIHILYTFGDLVM